MTNFFRHLNLCLLACCLLAPTTKALATDINLPAEPPTKRTVDPVEKWRIGGEDDEDILIGLVSAGIVGPDGNIYLLDSQLSQILVISPTGELVTTLGREGDGPGELRRPHGLFFQDDQTLGVVQGFPGKVTLLNLDGTPAGTITIGGEASEGGFNFVRKAMFADGKLVVQKGRGSFDQKTSKSHMTTTLSILNSEGHELVQIASRDQENDFAHRVFDEAKEFSEMNQWTLSPQGIIFTTPEREAYVIASYNLDGQLQHTLRRPFTTRKRKDDDKEKIASGVTMIMNGRRMEVETHVLDTDPAIIGLNVAADGRLFVTNSFAKSTELPDGIGARYDVISPTGEFLEELSLLIPDFNGENDDITFLDGTHFLHLRNIKSARDAARMGFGGGDQKDEDEEDLGDVEPLEIVMYTLP